MDSRKVLKFSCPVSLGLIGPSPWAYEDFKGFLA